MLYDIMAGGLLQAPATKEKTLLVDPKINFDSASSFVKGSPKKSLPGEAWARWRDDSGPIGQAIRAGKDGLLRAALESLRRKKTLLGKLDG